MPTIIDADTHVDESDATWSSIAGVDAEYAPVGISLGADNDRSGTTPFGSRAWLVEGKQHPRATRDDAHHPSLEKRQLDDVQGRLADMDRMGVDKQVIFPTFFIRYGTTDPQAEAAVAHGYNRWIAERCAMSGGRLQWAAVLPLLDQEKAVTQVRWAKANGACAIFRRGYDHEKTISDPHFFPTYEEADSADMPICVHTGHPLPGREWDRGFPVMGAFTDVVSSGLPDKFKNLKFGFIEAGAAWVPYVMSQLEQRQRAQRLHDRAQTFDLAKDLFRTNRLFVTVDPVDHIEQLLEFGTEDNLMVGTDYCHTDPSANLAALDEVQRWADEGKISDSVARKILETNAKHFYGF
ncbi:MAG: amidohydrolase family protein [Chloroflexi bacterium]|nr:amidohydrolase family protein [Chloroflexota bacterium]